MLKPYSFLMYFLAIIAFFFLGLVFAGITEAGKGQMLAGGAIVFGYGVVGAFIGFCLALLLAYNFRRSLILKINGLLALIIVASFAYFTIKYQKRQREKLENEPQKKEQPKTQEATSTAEDAAQDEQIAMFTNLEVKIQSETEMGLELSSPWYIF